MAERVCCRDDEVDEVLKARERGWLLVAVIKADVTRHEVDPDRDGFRTMPVRYELRELYFERR